ncbi:unannotated protein [freshwater metagenome]|uniref:Unannotated protein n=1 Tax=freshwater metagenome TaxID=449393 RepID=A0A6J6U1N3_9ZZZZ
MAQITGDVDQALSRASFSDEVLMAYTTSS